MAVVAAAVAVAAAVVEAAVAARRVVVHRAAVSTPVGTSTFVNTPPLQTSQQTTDPYAITLPEQMNVRSGPGLTYDIVTTVPQGTQAKIVGIAPDNEWYQVEIPGVTGQVWIYQGLTTQVGSLVGVRRWTAGEIALLPGGGGGGTVPLAITVPITMNVRSGPGTDYDVVRIVPQGTQGRIWGIDPNDDWFQIELEGLDTYVWVYQDLTTVLGIAGGRTDLYGGGDCAAAGADHAGAAAECAFGAGHTV